jgi:primosomal replication protein N
MSGILTPHSRLQRRGILRNTGVLTRSGVIRRDHAADPLERIPFSLRLQTHRGSGVPLGLYKDTSCTIPATSDGDAIAAWRDEISGSGLVAVQGVTTKRPILRFVSGLPALEFDGVDDHLTLTLARTFPFSLAVGAKGNTTAFGGMAGYGAYHIAIGNCYLDLAPHHSFWMWSPERAAGYGEENNIDLNWHSHVGLVPNGNVDKAAWSLYLDGLQTGSPGSPAGAPMLDNATTLFIGQDGNAAHWAGLMTSYLQADSVWSTDAVARISSHVRRINPDPLSGVPATLRLQTHRGDGVPVGLYKDTSCTIPATSEGDAIAAWRDEISGSGLTAVQSVTTRRPTLRFVSGKPVVRFDGVDDLLHTTLPAPAGKFSYAASGRYRSLGYYAALIGAPLGGVTFGGHDGTNYVGINKLGTNGPQTPVDVGTSEFAFVVTYQPNLYSYHVSRPGVADVVLADQPDGSGGYASSGSLTIGNGHTAQVPAAVDLTSVLILSGERWTAGPMERVAVHLHSVHAAPLP